MYTAAYKEDVASDRRTAPECAKAHSLVFLDRNCYDIIKTRMTTIQNGGRNHA